MAGSRSARGSALRLVDETQPAPPPPEEVVPPLVRTASPASVGGPRGPLRERVLRSMSVSSDHPPAAVHVCVLEGSITQQRATLARALKSERPDRVVAVTDATSPRDLRVLLALRPGGIVCAPDVEQALGVAVLAVERGQVSLPAALHAPVSERALSSREREVLALIVMGLTNADIARRLHVAETTVKTHVRRIFSKLGVHSRGEVLDVVRDPLSLIGPGVLSLTDRA